MIMIKVMIIIIMMIIMIMIITVLIIAIAGLPGRRRGGRPAQRGPRRISNYYYY